MQNEIWKLRWLGREAIRERWNEWLGNDSIKEVRGKHDDDIIGEVYCNQRQALKIFVFIFVVLLFQAFSGLIVFLSFWFVLSNFSIVFSNSYPNSVSRVCDGFFLFVIFSIDIAQGNEKMFKIFWKFN